MYMWNDRGVGWVSIKFKQTNILFANIHYLAILF